MNSLAKLLAGKRTYLVAIAAIAYLLLCQYTGQKPDETILGIFGALGLAALRAGIPANSAGAIAAVNTDTGYPFPPQTPRSQRNGSSSNGVLPCLLVGGLAMMLGTGCLTRPGELTQARVVIKDGSKSITLESHKDTSIKTFERAPDGTLKLEGYESNANQAAIKASTEQARMMENLMVQQTQMMSLFGGLAAQYFSGGIVRPPVNAVPATVVLTNAPTSTAAPAK